MTAIEIEHFRAFGFVVLRNACEAMKLAGELERATDTTRAAPLGTGVAQVQYAPMMVASTPYSLLLLDRFQGIAADLLGGPVLPLRAKGVRYYGNTAWHADSSDAIVASVGFAAYLEPLEAHNGALRVLPGSHRGDFGVAVLRYLALGADGPVEALPAVSIATAPGDVIAFDEHLVHASAGGTMRRQWRVDYVRDPTSPEEEAAVRAFLARVFPADWDGGYDVDRFPSYGPDWLDSSRPAVERLGQLGAYRLACAQENFARSRRGAT